MVLRKNFFLLLFIAVALTTISGCYNKPVRHLASDVALLKVGQSTEEDVLIFLGEPDEQQEVREGVEKWLYSDKHMTFLEKAPFVGKRLGSPEYKLVVVTISDDIVTDVIYSATDADDMDWADDYPWQEKKE
ncbi:MAG: hypothetical protein GY799_27510 [Desulfobulbaceae bacterium]|nr:hypothetical protein [Desulfobulbaceae bacterium]